MIGDKLFCWKMNEFPQKSYHEWEDTNWIIKHYAKTIDSILDLLAC